MDHKSLGPYCIVFVTSQIPKPHVVPLIDKLNYGRVLFPYDPDADQAVGRCKESMLKVDYFCIGLRIIIISSYDEL